MTKVGLGIVAKQFSQNNYSF